MLGSWLFWTAAGSSLAGHFAARARQPRRLMAGIEVLIAAVLPWTILAVRAAKGLLQTVPGEVLGPGPMLLTSVCALGPLSMLSGALFTAGSRVYAMAAGVSAGEATGSVYLWEAVGSSAGGVVAGWMLIRYLSSLEIAWLLAGAESDGCMRPGHRGPAAAPRGNGRTGRRGRPAWVFRLATKSGSNLPATLLARPAPGRDAQLGLRKLGRGGNGRKPERLRKRRGSVQRARSGRRRGGRPLRVVGASRHPGVFCSLAGGSTGASRKLCGTTRSNGWITWNSTPPFWTWAESTFRTSGVPCGETPACACT